MINRRLLNYSHDEHNFQWIHSHRHTHCEQLTCANVPTAIKNDSFVGRFLFSSFGWHSAYFFEFTYSSSTFNRNLFFFCFKFNSRPMTCATIYVTNNHQSFWIINRSTIFENGLENFKKRVCIGHVVKISQELWLLSNLRINYVLGL